MAQIAEVRQNSFLVLQNLADVPPAKTWCAAAIWPFINEQCSQKATYNSKTSSQIQNGLPLADPASEVEKMGRSGAKRQRPDQQPNREPAILPRPCCHDL